MFEEMGREKIYLAVEALDFNVYERAKIHVESVKRYRGKKVSPLLLWKS